MGVIIGSAVMPIAFLLLWRKANATGAILGSIIGCILGITSWLVVTKVEYGRVTLETTGKDAPMLVGNLVSILSGGAIHAVLSFLKPQNYDWESTKKITTVEKDLSELPVEEFSEESLRKAKSWIVKWGLGLTAVIVILWPVLSLPAREFSKGYFTLWSVIAIAWGTIGSAVIIALPLIESWDTITSVLSGMFTDDRLANKIEEMDTKLQAIILAVPEAERLYMMEKDKAKKKDLKDEEVPIISYPDGHDTNESLS